MDGSSKLAGTESPLSMIPTLRGAILAALVPAFAINLSAQCDGCVPDEGCTTTPAFPTLCPATAPDATAGLYYESDFTFWMPASFTDPGTGFEVTLNQLTITGVSGLPFGLDFTTNSPSGIYYPQEYEFGCARICGTPFGAGTYPISISILASVSAGGFDLDVPQELPTSITVLPGTGGTASFTYAPPSGCGSLTATFQALIDASPAPMSYAWDFGNGATASVPNPAQTYTGAGSYTVTLQTTIGGFVMQSLTLSSVNGDWCGTEVEEPSVPFLGCTGAPDLFFVLTDASGGTYTSSTFDDVSAAAWSDLSLLLDNPPYSISFYDEDPVSSNDLLGTYNLPLAGDGSYSFNVAGGTIGSLSIANIPQQVVLDSATIVVLPLPEVVISQNAQTGELCAEDQTLSAYAWLLDGQPVADATGPCVVPSGPGIWQVVGSNAFACSDTSNAIVVCPVFNLVQNGNVLFVPSGYESYAWTLDGEPIGDGSAFVFLQGDGLYEVSVDAGNGCIIELSFLWDTTGMHETQSAGPVLVAFPNPSEGEFTVVAHGLGSGPVQLEVLDMTGRTVIQRNGRAASGALLERFSLDSAPGPYLVRVRTTQEEKTIRLILR